MGGFCAVHVDVSAVLAVVSWKQEASSALGNGLLQQEVASAVSLAKRPCSMQYSSELLGDFDPILC